MQVVERNSDPFPKSRHSQIPRRFPFRTDTNAQVFSLTKQRPHIVAAGMRHGIDHLSISFSPIQSFILFNILDRRWAGLGQNCMSWWHQCSNMSSSTSTVSRTTRRIMAFMTVLREKIST